MISAITGIISRCIVFSCEPRASSENLKSSTPNRFEAVLQANFIGVPTFARNSDIALPRLKLSLGSGRSRASSRAAPASARPELRGAREGGVSVGVPKACRCGIAPILSGPPSIGQCRLRASALRGGRATGRGRGGSGFGSGSSGRSTVAACSG